MMAVQDVAEQTLASIEYLTSGLIDQAWRRGLAPEPQITVSEWADTHRMLPNTNAEPGPWRTSRVPYLREIMDCLSVSSPIEQVVLMKGAQTAGTEAGLNAVGYWIANAPGVIMSVLPSIEMVRRTSRTRIDPLIDGTPELRKRVARARTKDPGNTVGMKEFPGGALIMTGANSATSLRSQPVRYLVLDEVDAYPADAGREGDPVALAIQRTVTFRGRRKIFMISTPTHAGTSRIERAYAESDQRKYFVPCPSCGTFQLLRWANVRWPKDAPEQAYYQCESGCVIEEREKPKFLAGGEWRTTAAIKGQDANLHLDAATSSTEPSANLQKVTVAGFHLSALYSPFETWGEIAVDFLTSNKDPIRLKSWTNLKLGEPFEDRDSETVDAASFLSRLENWGDRIPDKVALITAGVDVQADRLECEIIGWGEGEESWSLSYDTFEGDPTKPEVWAALDAELVRTFAHPKLGALPIRAVAVDSGYQTQTVYQWTLERATRGFWPIKGRSGPGLTVWPQRPPRGRKTKNTPFIVGVDAAKEIFLGHLRMERPGPGYCHFPIGRDLNYFRQLTSERVVKTYKRGHAIREWRKDPGVRNEALDCRVYAYAALQGLHMRGIRLKGARQYLEDLPLMAIAGEPPDEMPLLAPVANQAPTVIRSAWMDR